MKISHSKLDEAARLYSLGDDVSAKQIYCDLLKDDPKNIALLIRYAVTCLNTGYYDLAIDACRRSLELAPRLPDSYFICGIAYYHSGDIVNSEKSFLKSLELNPSRRDIRDLWGKLKSQPYFSVSGGIQSTHSPERQVFMSAVVDLLKHDNQQLDILEIGSHAGSSTLTWANAVDKLFDGQATILCVDPWGLFGSEQSESNLADTSFSDQVYAAFLHNVSFVPDCVEVNHTRAPSREVLPRLKNGSFDIIYIDGCHFYKEVLEDITESKRIIRDGGIICGDDLELGYHEVDVEFTYINQQSDFIEDPKTGTHFHPGVTLALNDSFGRVLNFRGFWAMQKVGDKFHQVSFENATGVLPKHMPKALVEKMKTYIESSTLLGRLLN